MYTEPNTYPLEPEGELSIDLRRYLALAWHWAWLIVLVTALAAAGSYWYTSRQTPIYRATATVLVNEAPSTRVADYTTVLTNERLAKTYAQMMLQRPVLQQVVDELGMTRRPDSLKGAIKINSVVNTQLLTISVEDANPVLAADIANTLGTVFGQQVQQTQTSRYADSKGNLETQLEDIESKLDEARGQYNVLYEEQRQLAAQQSLRTGTPMPPAVTLEMERLETRINQYESIYSNLLLSYENVRMAEAQSISGVTLVEEALIPTRPVRPDVMQNTMLAAVVGLLLAVGVIFAIELLDDSLKSPDEVKRLFQLPVLGMIAQHDQDDGQLVTMNTPRSPVAEAFRSLRTNIQFASVDKPIRTLLVTSPAPSDGKTTVSSNLAAVLAQGGKRVALVDADLHRPRVHRVFNLDNSHGLSALFMEPKVQSNGWMQPTRQERLNIVSSGPLPPNPSELLGSQKMREIIDVMLQECDFVLLDTPPVLSVTDAAILSTVVDGVLLVVRPGETRMGALKQAVETMRRVNANLLGLVFNGVGKNRGYYDYYYKSYYYNYYDNHHKRTARKGGLFGGLRQRPRAERRAEPVELEDGLN